MKGDGVRFGARSEHEESESPIDLPLHDHEPRPDEGQTPVSDRLNGLSRPVPGSDPQPFADEASRAPRNSGNAALIAGALVIGLLTGFAGGFLLGQRGSALPSPRGSAPVGLDPAQAAERPTAPEERRPAVEATGTAAAPGLEVGGRPHAAAQTYTDARVADPAPAPGVQVAPRADDQPAMRGDAQVSPRAAAVEPPAPVGAEVARADSSSTVAGTVEFASRPAGARVFLDGALVGTTPLAVAAAKPGSHRVRLELPGYRPWLTSVTVEPGSRVRVGASLER